MAGERALYVVVCDQVFSRPGSSSHIQKTLKSTEKQESEKRIKMQQEVVEVIKKRGGKGQYLKDAQKKDLAR